MPGLPSGQAEDNNRAFWVRRARILTQSHRDGNIDHRFHRTSTRLAAAAGFRGIH